MLEIVSPPPVSGDHRLLDEVRAVVASALDIGRRVEGMDASAPLLGAVPELDSIGVLSLITSLEERFGIHIADDDVAAADFETLGSLANLVEHRLPV
jgi:acyl carrier protein